MLIISNEEIESLLSVDLALKALERAYLGQDHGTAVNRPRSDLYLPGVYEGSVYVFKTMEGGLVESKIVALRLNSDVIRWEERENRVVKDKVPMAPGKKWVGLIQLFSAETGEPLAIFPDGVIQRMRVAVTSALAAKEMARQDASVMAIFGSGWQAGAHVPAFCAVRNNEAGPDVLQRADVIARLGTSTLFADRSAREVTTGSDGMFGYIAGTADEKKKIPSSPFHGIDNPNIGTVPNIMAGRWVGRADDRQITFLNNQGTQGLQFAAVGGTAYNLAKAKGLGHPLPLEWFTQNIRD